VERKRQPFTRAFRKKGIQRKRRDTRYRGRTGSTERPRDGLLAVLAEHSPDGWEPGGCWSGRWGTNVPGTPGREGDAGHHGFLEGPLGETPGALTVSRKLQRSAEQAKRSPAMVFNNVLHLIDREFLREAYRQTRKSRAPGVDQGTATQYADNLDDNLQELHERLRDNRSVAPPVARVWIEKDDGKQRPIGQPCCEDQMVQRAVGMILEAIFDQDFHAFAHGFRKGHSQHQALHALRAQGRKLPINGRVDAEVSGFFDNLDGDHLRELITQRVHDGGIRRLLGKWLHAGVLEAGERTHPDKGTPQGGVVSPMVSNVFLHRVLDEWFVKDVQPRMKGRCFLTRFADDCAPRRREGGFMN
jgi:RNA-directed DNA polymerase